MQPDFDFDDIDPNIPDEVKIAIADLFLSWGKFDNAVTFWATAILRRFGLPEDVCSIFIGNMDTRTKLDRIKAVFSHFGYKDVVSQIAKLIKSHGREVEIRNALAHRHCAGMISGNKLVFVSMKHRLGEVGNVDMFVFKTSEIDHALKFSNYALLSVMQAAQVALENKLVPQNN